MGDIKIWWQLFTAVVISSVMSIESSGHVIIRFVGKDWSTIKELCKFEGCEVDIVFKGVSDKESLNWIEL
jgi:hypothetical protein